MTPEEKRDRARDLLDAFAAGAEIDKLISMKVYTALFVDYSVLGLLPKDVGIYWHDYDRMVSVWCAPTEVVNAVRRTLRI